MIDPIEALADCIMQFEGWKQPGSIGFPRGSTSWRNRNPGNLRPWNNSTTQEQPRDDKGYRIFTSLELGWLELKTDLHVKVSGITTHNLTLQSTLHDLFSIYAPALDQNDPTQYSRVIALWMSHIYNVQVTPTTILADILKLGK